MRLPLERAHHGHEYEEGAGSKGPSFQFSALFQGVGDPSPSPLYPLPPNPCGVCLLPGTWGAWTLLECGIHSSRVGQSRRGRAAGRGGSGVMEEGPLAQAPGETGTAEWDEHLPRFSLGRGPQCDTVELPSVPSR